MAAKTSKPAIAISLLIIGLGIGSLLNNTNVIPGVDWIWVVALGISGILLLSLAKLDRFNFVVGTTLIICSVLAVLRHTKQISVNIEAPILSISIGLMLLLSHLLRLPGSADKKAETPNDPTTPGPTIT